MLGKRNNHRFQSCQYIIAAETKAKNIATFRRALFTSIEIARLTLCASFNSFTGSNEEEADEVFSCLFCITFPFSHLQYCTKFDTIHFNLYRASAAIDYDIHYYL